MIRYTIEQITFLSFVDGKANGSLTKQKQLNWAQNKRLRWGSWSTSFSWMMDAVYKSALSHFLFFCHLKLNYTRGLNLGFLFKISTLIIAVCQCLLGYLLIHFPDFFPLFLINSGFYIFTSLMGPYIKLLVMVWTWWFASIVLIISQIIPL